MQPVTRLVVPSLSLFWLLPLPEMVPLRVMVFDTTVTSTLSFMPDRVAFTVSPDGSCLGPISYFSRSALISARRHSHWAFVEITVPSCIMNGLGSFMFFFMAPPPGADLGHVQLQLILHLGQAVDQPADAPRPGAVVADLLPQRRIQLVEGIGLVLIAVRAVVLDHLIRRERQLHAAGDQGGGAAHADDQAAAAARDGPAEGDGVRPDGDVH